MKNRTVLVTGCGGPAATGFIRSLLSMDTPPRIIGTDSDKYALLRSEAPVSYLVPSAREYGYINEINRLCVAFDVDLIHAQADVEVGVLSAQRHKLEADVWLPHRDEIVLCHDKWESFLRFKKAGMIVPATVLLRTKHDLDGAMRWGDVWIRDITGAAGAGSLDRPTKAEALAHITRRKGWGKMIISEYLSKETATWQAIYEDGFLVMAQGRLRHGWSFGNRTQSGVTGLTAVGETIMAPALDRLGLQAIAAVSDKPHGIYGVDFCKDKYGVWNPTEINIGRFFTTIEFFTQCGLNMPEAYLQLAFGTYEGAYHSLNKCRSGMLWVRGIDTRPTLIHKDTVPCQENASISTN